MAQGCGIGTDQENSTSFDQMAGAIWRVWSGGVLACVSFGITFLKLFPSLCLLRFFFRRSFLLGNSSSCSVCVGVFRLNRLIPVSINARRECNEHSPRTSLGRNTLLPWALTTISQTTVAVPESDAREGVCACVKGVVAGTSLGSGTSATVRILLANAKFADGRPHAVRRSGARMRPRKPSTHRRNGCAAAKPSRPLNR